jgi:DNA-binding NarL/FixJ family response regulator
MMLNTQPDFLVIGEANNGKDAIQKTLDLAPDVVLLDLEMPVMDGVATLEAIQQSTAPAAVLVFTAFDTDERIVGAIQAGAKGYLLKGAPRAEIFNAVRVIGQGGSLLQPVIASKLIHHITSQHDLPSLENLTEREKEVLGLMAQGKTNREIAELLVITERTVKFHVSSILDKLGADNRTEAVTIAVQRGLVNLKE